MASRVVLLSLTAALLASCDDPEEELPGSCAVAAQDSTVGADAALEIRGASNLHPELYSFEDVPCTATEVLSDSDGFTTTFACGFADGTEPELVLDLSTTGSQPWDAGEALMLSADYNGESIEGVFNTLSVWVRSEDGRLLAAAHSGKYEPAAALAPHLGVEVDPLHCRTTDFVDEHSAPMHVRYEQGGVEVELVGQNRGVIQTPSGSLSVEQGRATSANVNESIIVLRFVALAMD